jgi:hypothetical protein
MSEDRNHNLAPCGDHNFPQSAFASPPDVSLLLRAHSEQRWLSHEVIPVVRQIETPERLPEEQLPAAFAYLEVIWAEASNRAREADVALRKLDTFDPARQSLPVMARRYHTAVRVLREATARRVAVLIAADYAGRASSACRR